ncbi:MAG TPA: hypothetical protein VFW05_16850 [Verrucomicrobiae bacterium]|nr:hypothetical protein [Verrucomicrobiae bacterium]
MQDSETQQHILSLLRAEFQREREGGFSRLRQIPSDGVRRYVDYFCALGSDEADLLAEASAHWGLATFFPYDAIQPPDSIKRAHELFVHAPTDWRHRPEASKPAKAVEIRRVVKLAFTQVISPLHTSHRGGLWHYAGLRNGRDITVNIDYHQKYAQFQYGITHPLQSQEVGKANVDLSYERLLGVGGGAWDIVEQAHLDQDIALLRDLIIHCHDFLQSLPAPHEDTKRT